MLFIGQDVVPVKLIMLLWMMCSSNLQAIDVKDTGLYFEGRCISPFLNTGTIWASLQSDGVSSSASEYWYSCDTIRVSSPAALFGINDDIQAGHVALWGFRYFSNLNKPFVLITMFSMDGYLLCPLSGIVLVFALVYTDWNCSLSISALYVVSLCIKPSFFFNGATPVNSWLFLLIAAQKPLGFWDVATYTLIVHNGEIEFVTNVPLYQCPACRSRYEADLAVSVVSFISSSKTWST